MIDIYSHYACVKLLKNIKAKNVANKFEQIFMKGAPTCLQSGEGKEFQGIHTKLAEKYELDMFHTYDCEIKTSIVECLIQELKNGRSYLNSLVAI